MADNFKSMIEEKDPELVKKRRAQLVDAAIELFSRVGYHVATVKDVADEAGVSAGLVYQYVADKQDLLFLCFIHIAERKKQEIPLALDGVHEPLARLYAAIEAYSRMIAAEQHAILLFYREIKSLKREQVEVMKRLEFETNDLIVKCIEECIQRGYLAPTNVELLVYRIIINAHAWALKAWRLPKIVSLDGYIEQCIHACWVSFLTRKGKRKYAELRPSNASVASTQGKPARARKKLADQSRGNVPLSSVSIE